VNSTWDQLEVHFEALLRLAAPERAVRLNEIERAHPALAQELRALLDNADRTLAFPVDAASQALLDTLQLDEGSRLKDYRLVRRLGQGGMGVVYLARREADYEQYVAIKLGRNILDREESVRFQRERQILAQLNHPNIARLLDGGTTPAQTPFLVMEYIDGDQIDHYCRQKPCGLIETLSLFQSVCDAVSHAHQQLVVHRDIKPSNVLVQRDGTARLLDFGIAKIIDPLTGNAETCTQVMTPAYVAPEQIKGQAVGTPTDVYALGLLLYELLTGDRAQPVSADNLSELNRVVTEVEPTPLRRALKRESSLLTPAGRALVSSGRAWQNDLQNILERALDKESARRYASVAALATDIENLKSGNPVDASGDSLGYRLTKLARKYRYRFAALAVAVTSVVVLAIGLTVATLMANQARDDAERRLSQSEALVRFMLGDLRSQLEPNVSLQVLDALSEKAMGYFLSLDPADQTDASLAQLALSLRQIGEIRLSQGRVAEGRSAFRRSMELSRSLHERAPDEGQRLFDLGQSYFWLGFAAHRDAEFEAARVPFTRYLEISRTLVERDPERLDWLLELSYAYNNLGTLDQRSGQFERARQQFQRSLEIKQRLVASQPDNLLWQNELADTLAWLADTAAALGELTRAAEHQAERLALVTTLAATQPNNFHLQRSVGYASLALARQRLALGQFEQVSSLIGQSIALADQRRRADAENLQWVEDAARARLDLARHEILVGRLPQALSLLDEADALTGRLLVEPEPEPDWAIRLQARAQYLRLLARSRSTDDGDLSGELERLQEALVRLSLNAPEGTYLQRLRARVSVLAGDVAVQRCNAQQAQALWQAALAHLDPLDHPPPDAMAIEAVAFHRLGRNAQGAIRTARLEAIGYAEPWYQQARQDGQALLECSPSSARLPASTLNVAEPIAWRWRS